MKSGPGLYYTILTTFLERLIKRSAQILCFKFAESMNFIVWQYYEFNKGCFVLIVCHSLQICWNRCFFFFKHLKSEFFLKLILLPNAASKFSSTAKTRIEHVISLPMRLKGGSSLLLLGTSPTLAAAWTFFVAWCRIRIVLYGNGMSSSPLKQGTLWDSWRTLTMRDVELDLPECTAGTLFQEASLYHHPWCCAN